MNEFEGAREMVYRRGPTMRKMGARGGETGERGQQEGGKANPRNV